MRARVVCESSLSSVGDITHFAETLKLDLVREGTLSPEDDVTHVLFFDGDRLSLRRNIALPPSPTCVDFTDAALQYRRRTLTRNQGIASAVGLKIMPRPLVVDATAGLGRDAFILASLGCRVLMFERSPIIHALLADGLRRAGECSELDSVVARLSLRKMDAVQWCRQPADVREPTPDVLYLDPMFPSRGKTARVKKDIELMQTLLGPDEDIAMLMELARQTATRRVVVKQPGKRTRNAEPAPDFQVPGNACHFDVYLTRILHK